MIPYDVYIKIKPFVMCRNLYNLLTVSCSQLMNKESVLDVVDNQYFLRCHETRATLD